MFGMYFEYSIIFQLYVLDLKPNRREQRINYQNVIKRLYFILSTGMDFRICLLLKKKIFANCLILIY